MLFWSQHGRDVNFRAMLLANGCSSMRRESLFDGPQVPLDVIIGFANVLSRAEAPGLCSISKNDQAKLNSSEVLQGWTDQFRLKLKTVRATSNFLSQDRFSSVGDYKDVISV